MLTCASYSAFMIEPSQPRPLSALLNDLKTALHGGDVTVETLLESFHERGFGFFLLVLGLISTIPIPGLGLRTVLAVPMMLLTLQQAMGFHKIWMPASIKSKAIQGADLQKMIDHLLPWTHRLEKISRPRLGFMTQGIISRLVGACGFIMAACIFMPIILTNMVPGIGLTLMSAGVLMRDGIAVLIGMILGTVYSIGWFVAFFWLGARGLDLMVQSALSWLS